MSQIARSLISADPDSLEAVVNTLQERQLRQHVRDRHQREQRRDVHRNPRPQVALCNTYAPGVDVAEHMGKTWFRDLPRANLHF